MSKPIGSRTELIEVIARERERLCFLVAEDVGEGPDDVRADVHLALALLADPERGRAPANRARIELVKRGSEAAETALPAERLIDRFMSALPAIWRMARDLDVEQAALQDLALWLLHGADVAALAIAEGYNGTDRAIVARDATARRAFLEELLSNISLDAGTAARLRRMAIRYGLDPSGSYRLIEISPHHGALEDEAHQLADRLAARLGAPSSADWARAEAGGMSLPQVIARQRRIVILARADWPGFSRIRSALDEWGVGWTAVAGVAVDGVEGLSTSLARSEDTLRAADRMARTGWVDDPDDLAVERLLMLDESLLAAVVGRELGPLLAVPRMGTELVETLRVFFETGENIRETGRRLHLASRTVAYRLERIEQALGHPIDGDIRPRLSVALMAYRALDQGEVLIPVSG